MTKPTGVLREITPEEQPAVDRLGALIRQTRITAGLTQPQLAAASSIGKRHLQRLEAGERRPRQSTLERIADFLATMLGMDPDALLDLMLETGGSAVAPESEHLDKTEPRRRAKARRRWLEELQRDHFGRMSRRRSLPEEQRQAALATLRAMRRAAGLTDA